MHEPVYDLPALIAGVRPALERRPERALVIAGDGSRRGALERLARDTLPAGRFEFVGAARAPAPLAALLGRAEIYLSASRSDSTSVSLLEAMACGAVPVVSDIEGNREWVGEGDGARLFASGRRGGRHARALERALGDPAWREAARARNRRVIAGARRLEHEHGDGSRRCSKALAAGARDGARRRAPPARERASRMRRLPGAVLLLSAARGRRCPPRAGVHAPPADARLGVHRGVRGPGRLLGGGREPARARSAGTEVIRVRGGSALSAWLAFTRAAPAGARHAPSPDCARLSDWWLMPDSYAGWAARARGAAASGGARAGGFDAMLSSSPPDSVHPRRARACTAAPGCRGSPTSAIRGSRSTSARRRPRGIARATGARALGADTSPTWCSRLRRTHADAIAAGVPRRAA
jgi:hypothetical protein